MNEIDVIDRNDPEYTALLDNVGNAIEAGKGKAVAAINSAMVEFEQHGHENAEYGSNTLKMLAADLSVRYGKGFSWSNIYRM